MGVGCLCGAIVGAQMIIGSQFGRDNKYGNENIARAKAKELAQNSDLMIVVGSKKSANTTHLAEILKDITKTIHIENDTELGEFEGFIKSSTEIGITAGASTPQNIIDKVLEKINS